MKSDREMGRGARRAGTSNATSSISSHFRLRRAGSHRPAKMANATGKGNDDGINEGADTPTILREHVTKNDQGNDCHEFKLNSELMPASHAFATFCRTTTVILTLAMALLFSLFQFLFHRGNAMNYNCA